MSVLRRGEDRAREEGDGDQKVAVDVLNLEAIVVRTNVK